MPRRGRQVRAAADGAGEQGAGAGGFCATAAGAGDLGTDVWTGGHVNRQAGTQLPRHAQTCTYGQMGTQIDGHRSGRTHRQTHRRRDLHAVTDTEGHKDRRTCRLTQTRTDRRTRTRSLPQPSGPLHVPQDVVNTHPGLSFLKEAPEFHSRYITTVSNGHDCMIPVTPSPLSSLWGW